MTKLNCMIDLETLSTNYNAAIVSIGAVIHSDSEIKDEFKVNVSAESCKAAGLHLSKDTIQWWSTQSKEARDSWMRDAIPLEDALKRFSNWYGNKSMYTWGYGANFDIVIMESAFKSVDMTAPWKYYDVMCLRTVVNMVGQKITRAEGTHHDALDDARNQAKWLMSAL